MGYISFFEWVDLECLCIEKQVDIFDALADTEFMEMWWKKTIASREKR